MKATAALHGAALTRIRTELRILDTESLQDGIKRLIRKDQQVIKDFNARANTLERKIVEETILKIAEKICSDL